MNVTETAEPTCVLPSGPLVMMSGPATIVMENEAEPLLPDVSAAFTVKLNVPGVVGVPCISPMVVTFNPGGTAPEKVKVYGPPFPPVAESCALYGTLTVPPGADPVTCSGGIGAGAIVRTKDALAVCEPLSVSVTARG